MEPLPKYDPLGRPPKKRRSRFRITLMEAPLIITMGALVFVHIWYGTYLFSDELSEDNRVLKYVPLRSEYEDMKKGFNNIRKRFSAKKSAEMEKNDS